MSLPIKLYQIFYPNDTGSFFLYLNLELMQLPKLLLCYWYSKNNGAVIVPVKITNYLFCFRVFLTYFSITKLSLTEIILVLYFMLLSLTLDNPLDCFQPSLFLIRASIQEEVGHTNPRSLMIFEAGVSDLQCKDPCNSKCSFWLPSCLPDIATGVW